VRMLFIGTDCPLLAESAQIAAAGPDPLATVTNVRFREVYSIEGPWYRQIS